MCTQSSLTWVADIGCRLVPAMGDVGMPVASTVCRVSSESGAGGRRLGDILVSWGVLSPQELQHYLRVQQADEQRKRLGQILLDEDRVTEVMLAQALAEANGLQFVDLTEQRIDPDVARLVPMALGQRAGILPLSLLDGTPSLAAIDPLNVVAFDDVALLLQGHPQIRRLEVVVAPESQVRRRLSAMWSEVTAADALRTAASVEVIKDDAGAVTAVDQILRTAMRLGASDIHIEPLREVVRVRMRVDGSLRRVMVLPKPGQAPLVSRIKILAGIDISQKRTPQDGRARVHVDGVQKNVRVSTLPTMHGEKVVIRLLTDIGELPALRALGLPDPALATLHAALRATQGLVLITGPTGSGKTTTLYSAVHEVVAGDRNIIALEEPIEIELPGVSQVQIDERSGLTFAAGLRSVLRQDPDIIMIGEVRDQVTADLAIRAALTGHLVLATVHTVDAPSAVLRLAEMGVPRYLIASSLRLVIAQRLVRRPCPRCAVLQVPDEQTRQRLGLTSAQAQAMVVGPGCDSCEGLGLRGRTGIFEVLSVTRPVRAALLAGGDEMAVAAAARSAGWQPLQEAAIDAAAHRRTTIAEVLQVVASAAD